MDTICSGEGGIDVWTDGWDGGSLSTCSTFYHNLLFTLDDGSPGYNPGNLNVSQVVGRDAFEFLLDNQDGDIQDPPTDSQDDILQACIFTPGLCDLGLQEYCPTKTRDEIMSNPELLSFCGCYAPTDPLLEGIETQCDPLCNQTNTIPIQDPMTGLALQCDSNALIPLVTEILYLSLVLT